MKAKKTGMNTPWTKTVSVLLAAAMIGCALTACGGDAEDTPDTAQTTATTKATATSTTAETTAEDIAETTCVFVTDNSGATVTDENGDAVTEAVPVTYVTVTGEDGAAVTDADGAAVTSAVAMTSTAGTAATTAQTQTTATTKATAASTKASTQAVAKASTTIKATTVVTKAAAAQTQPKSTTTTTTASQEVPVYTHSIEYYMTGQWNNFDIYPEEATCRYLTYEELCWVRDQANAWIVSDLVPYCQSLGGAYANVEYNGGQPGSWDTHSSYFPSKEAALEWAKAWLSYDAYFSTLPNGCGGALGVTVETYYDQLKRNWPEYVDTATEVQKTRYELYINH